MTEDLCKACEWAERAGVEHVCACEEEVEQMSAGYVCEGGCRPARTPTIPASMDGPQIRDLKLQPLRASPMVGETRKNKPDRKRHIAREGAQGPSGNPPATPPGAGTGPARSATPLRPRVRRRFVTRGGDLVEVESVARETR